MTFPLKGRRRLSGRGKSRRQSRRLEAAHAAERLERRSMFAGAQPFVPLYPAGPPSGVDPDRGGLLYDQSTGTTYYKWYDSNEKSPGWKWADGTGTILTTAPPASAVRVDSDFRPIALPLNQTAQQSWVLADNSTLVLFGSSIGTGTFRRYAADGTALSWPTVFDGRVKDVLQTDDKGFLIWGNVADRAEAGWIRGGFDVTFNGGVDGYVAKLDPDGVLQWATLVGGAGMDTVESVAVSPDGGTIFVVGDTSTSGGFVHGTADQVHDASTKSRVSIGRNITGEEITVPVMGQASITSSLGGTIQFNMVANDFTGIASSTNGYVMVLSGDGTKHLWSSYLSPQDDRNLPLSGEKFLASNAAFVTEVDSVGSLTRAGIVVSREAGATGTGQAPASSAIVTLVEVAPGKNLQTGTFGRDFAFKSIAGVSVPDVFYASVKSKPTGGKASSRYYYYMTAVPDGLEEIDTIAYDPVVERDGVPGRPSTRSLGRLEFSVGTGGDVQVNPNFYLDVNTFSLTSYFATPDAIYLTGTTLSNRQLAFGQQVGGYHTYPYPVKGKEVGNNYGDVVLVELSTSGAPVRTQLVGNIAGDPAQPLAQPPYGFKEKGGSIAVAPNAAGSVDVRLMGTAFAQPAPRQGATAPIGGRYWTYRDTTKKAASLAAAFAASAAAAEPSVVVAAAGPVASAVAATVQWTGYIGTAGNDGVSDAWSIRKTDANGLADNQVVLQNSVGSRSGYTAGQLAPTNWNDGIRGSVAQIQLNEDATKLYVAGSTTVPGWTKQGFDSKLGEFTEVYNSSYKATFTSSDGFFSRVDVKSGVQDYSTYLGGNGEAFDYTLSPGGRFEGQDFSTAFYIDPTASVNQGTALVVGRSSARSGLGSQDGVTDQPQQETYFNLPFKQQELLLDRYRSLGSFGTAYDATIYMLNDHPDGIGQPSEQLRWASYLSPRDTSSPVATPDNEGQTIAFLLMQNADFIWRAKDASGIGNLVYVFGDDIQGASRSANGIENLVQGPLQKAVYVFNDAKVNDSNIPIGERIRKSLDVYWNTPNQIVVAAKIRRADGSTDQPSVFFRRDEIRDQDGNLLSLAEIRRIDLPTVASWDRPMEGVGVAWSKTFPADNDFWPRHMALSGDKLYLASTTGQYSWSNFIPPLPGKYRNGPSDAVLMQLDAVKAGNVDWWMIQGGDGADTGTAVAAFPDGRVMLFGQSSSQPSDTNKLGWVGATTAEAAILGNRQASPANSRKFVGGVTDAFTVVVQTSNVQTLPSKAEINVAGMVAGQSVSIASGTTTPSTAQGTDLGSLVRGGMVVEQTFRVANTGTELLALSLDAIPSGWSLKTGLPNSLVAGTFQDFTLEFTPSAVGTYTGQVIISSSDADEDTYTFTLKAVVIPPPPSTLSVVASPATIAEGNSGTTTASFTVTLVPGTPVPTYPVQVSYATVAGTAMSGVDFTPVSGTLSFAAGETAKTVSVPVIGDITPEFNETFKLVLSSPTGGTVVSATAGEATLTIATDDGTPVPPTIGFLATSESVIEGGVGLKTPATLTVRLLKAESVPVSVKYTATSGTATSGSDFVAATGTVTIPAGSLEVKFNVDVVGDGTAEPNEQFTVRLSNATAGALIDNPVATITIVNDDGDVGPPPLRVSNASVVEGNSGTPRLRFTITLARASKSKVDLDYNTVGITAVAGIDFTNVSGRVTILAGRTTAIVSVPVIPNRTYNGNRVLKLRVKSGNTLLGVGEGTIIDDEKAPRAAPAVAFAAFAALSEPSSVTKRKR